MLKKIDTVEIMTKHEVKTKYRTQYILMVMTEIVDDGDNDLGYVIYTADQERDFDPISRDEYKGKIVSYLIGGAAEPYPTFEKWYYINGVDGD